MQILKCASKAGVYQAHYFIYVKLTWYTVTIFKQKIVNVLSFYLNVCILTTACSQLHIAGKVIVR